MTKFVPVDRDVKRLRVLVGSRIAQDGLCRRILAVYIQPVGTMLNKRHCACLSRRTSTAQVRQAASIAKLTRNGIEHASQPVPQWRLLAGPVAASVMLLLCASAFSQQPSSAGKSGAGINYPERPIRLVLPTAPGGATDTVARVVVPYLSESLGQQIIIDNRPGAGGIIGTEIAAKATPDGYTLLMFDISLSVMPHVFKALPFDLAKDLMPIASVSSVPFVLVANISTPFKSVDDLITAARSKPGQLNFGSAGIGSPPHLAPELLAGMAGVTFTHVAFKGAPQALTEVIAGRLEFMFVSMPLAKPQIDAGRVRGLAVSTSRRAAALPNLPTVDEAGIKGFDVTVWNGIFAPSGTRNDVITKLSDHVIRALNDPEVKEKLAARGAEPRIMTQAEFSKYFQSEFAKWGQVVKRSAAKPQ